MRLSFLGNLLRFCILNFLDNKQESGGDDPDTGKYSPVSGTYEVAGGDGAVVDLTVHNIGNSTDLRDEGGGSYTFDSTTGMVSPIANGAAESVCPSCYFIGAGGVKFGANAFTKWLPSTLGNSKIGHRLFTATRKNGTWNTGKFRFGWSGKNGSDTYKLMFRYKKTHIPSGIKTTHAHPSGG